VPKPLRLGVSGSSFIFVMPEELLARAYQASVSGALVAFDDRLNAMMVEFMREMMRAVNTLDIEALECYHTLAWDRDLILDVALENPNVEFWSVHAPYGLYCDPSAPVERARDGAVEAYCDTVEVAARLGARIVVAHPGASVKYDCPRELQIELSIKPFREVADFAGERGISLAVEPLPKNEIGCTLDELLDVVERIDRPNVGVNFDTNHLFPPEAIPDMIRRAGQRILSVHISDQDGVERHWLPFLGTMDWAEVLRAIVDIGYTGPLIYETHIHDARSCDEVARIIVDNYHRLIRLAPV
jgi:sugar phosphate isomerase/epimerase